MARLYCDEDFDERVALELQRLGHDVNTVIWANRRQVNDRQVLHDASAEFRIVVTFNRNDFRRLHQLQPNHAGIVSCTRDDDILALAQRIHDALLAAGDMTGQHVRVNRP